MHGYRPEEVTESDMISRGQMTELDDGCSTLFYRVLEGRNSRAMFSEFSKKDSQANLSRMVQNTKRSSEAIGALTKQEWEDTLTWAFRQLT